MRESYRLHARRTRRGVFAYARGRCDVLARRHARLVPPRDSSTARRRRQPRLARPVDMCLRRPQPRGRHGLFGNGHLRTAENVETSSYPANSLNRYALTLCASASLREILPLHDVDGNMTHDGMFTYDYDSENRLVSVCPLSPAARSAHSRTFGTWTCPARNRARERRKDTLPSRWTARSTPRPDRGGWRQSPEKTCVSLFVANML